MPVSLYYQCESLIASLITCQWKLVRLEVEVQKVLVLRHSFQILMTKVNRVLLLQLSAPKMLEDSDDEAEPTNDNDEDSDSDEEEAPNPSPPPPAKA